MPEADVRAAQALSRQITDALNRTLDRLQSDADRPSAMILLAAILMSLDSLLYTMPKDVPMPAELVALKEVQSECLDIILRLMQRPDEVKH